MKTITIIGYGKMAQAIAKGLNNRFKLEIIGRDEKKILDFINSNSLLNTSYIITNDIINLQSKIVVLAIKPYALNAFKYEGEASILYSLLAGVEIKKLKLFIEASHFCRVMPNVASFVNKGTNLIYPNNEEINEFTNSIFGEIGSIFFLDKESYINSAGAISGSGPAYLGLFAEALIDAGVREGLNLELSKQLVKNLFQGFSALLDKKEALEIRLDTTSPNGTTTEGIDVFERKATRGIIREAVHAATLKANNI